MAISHLEFMHVFMLDYIEDEIITFWSIMHFPQNTGTIFFPHPTPTTFSTHTQISVNATVPVKRCCWPFSHRHFLVIPRCGPTDASRHDGFITGSKCQLTPMRDRQYMWARHPCFYLYTCIHAVWVCRRNLQGKKYVCRFNLQGKNVGR